jgi:hypothetical protein
MSQQRSPRIDLTPYLSLSLLLLGLLMLYAGSDYGSQITAVAAIGVSFLLLEIHQREDSEQGSA